MSWENVGSTQSESTKLDFMKFKAGEAVKIRVADAAPVDRWCHWIPGKNRNVTCLGKDVCPICAIVASQKENGETPSYGTSRKYALHIIDRSSGTLKLLEGSANLFDQLKALQIDEDLPDLQEFDVKVTRNGTGQNTTYTAIPQMPKALTEADKALLENKIDLADKLKPMSVDALEQLLRGE